MRSLIFCTMPMQIMLGYLAILAPASPAFAGSIHSCRQPQTVVHPSPKADTRIQYCVAELAEGQNGARVVVKDNAGDGIASGYIGLVQGKYRTIVLTTIYHDVKSGFRVEIPEQGQPWPAAVSAF